VRQPQPKVPMLVGDRTGGDGASIRNDVHPVLCGPTSGVGMVRAIPEGWIRFLESGRHNRHVVQIEMDAMKRERAASHRFEHDCTRFVISAFQVFRTNAVELKLGRDSTAPRAQFHPAAADLVEHTDLFEGTERLI